MGGHRDKTKEPMSWLDENEYAFVGIFYDNVKAEKLQCSIFTKNNWGKINQDIIGLTKMDYGIERLKDKWNRVCKMHHLFTELVRHIGVVRHIRVTWDPNINKVDAWEEVWQHFFMVFSPFFYLWHYILLLYTVY